MTQTAAEPENRISRETTSADGLLTAHAAHWAMPPGRRGGSATFWRVNIVTWLALAVVTTLLRSIFYDGMRPVIVTTVILETTGFTYTCLLHFVYRRIIGRSRQMLIGALLAVVLSLAGGLMQTFVVSKVQILTGGPLRTGYSTSLMAPFFYVPLFGGWSIAYFWISAQAAVRAEHVRRIEAEATALRAELRFLQSQLDPHFLFNALNTIAAEIPGRPDVALEMTRSVASYLRIGLEGGGGEVCPLADEVGNVKDYLRIQELRFEDRLVCDFQVNVAALDVRVPRLVVQGLVENAIKHGRRGANRCLEVQVRADLVEDLLTIEVINHGRFAPSESVGTGLGIENTRRRLAIAYPGRHNVDIEQRGEEVVVRLALRGEPCFA